MSYHQQGGGRGNNNRAPSAPYYYNNNNNREGRGGGGGGGGGGRYPDITSSQQPQPQPQPQQVGSGGGSSFWRGGRGRDGDGDGDGANNNGGGSRGGFYIGDSSGRGGGGGPRNNHNHNYSHHSWSNHNHNHNQYNHRPPSSIIMNDDSSRRHPAEQPGRFRRAGGAGGSGGGRGGGAGGVRGGDGRFVATAAGTAAAAEPNSNHRTWHHHHHHHHQQQQPSPYSTARMKKEEDELLTTNDNNEKKYNVKMKMADDEDDDDDDDDDDVQGQQHERTTTTTNTNTNTHNKIREWTARVQTYERILREKPIVNERMQVYQDEMTPTERLIFFYPEGVTLEDIPPLDPPTDWEERVEKAIVDLEEEVKDRFVVVARTTGNRKRPRNDEEELEDDNQERHHHDATATARARARARAVSGEAAESNKPVVAVTQWERENAKPTDPEKLKVWIQFRDAERRFNNDDDCDDDDDDDMSDDGFGIGTHQNDDDDDDDDDEERKREEERSYAPAVHFLKTLQYCPPLTAPFTAIAMSYQSGKNDQCYCPCGKHMDRWRRYFGNDFFIDQTRRCDYKGKALPNRLWKHILTKKDECKAHWVVYAFLKQVFQNYHGKGKQHIALEDVGTKAFNDAKRIIMKSVEDQITGLKKIAEEKKQLEIRLRKAEEDREVLQRTNGELSNKLATEKMLKQRLNATNEENFTSDRKELAKFQYNNFRSFIRDIVTKGLKGPARDVKISVDQDFHINDCFSKWYQTYVYEGASSERDLGRADPRYFAFLFAPLSESPAKSQVVAEERLQVISEWKIDLKAAQRAKKAKDEGGPTRHFFNRIWLQLSDLSVSIPGNEDTNMKLFESGTGGLVPTQDSTITGNYLDKLVNQSKRRSIKEQIISYYRAVGRILAHAMLLSEEDSGPIPISSNVLPRLYKNVLLRGLDVDSNLYVLGDLIDHSMELIAGIDFSKNMENILEAASFKLGITAADEQEQRVQIREQLKSLYVDERSTFAIQGIRSGLSLGGIVKWSTCFGWVPTQTVSQLAFGQQELTRNMVFDQEGRFRFIRFTQHEGDPEAADADLERQTQQLFQQEMARLFAETLEDDPTFMARFLCWCTGSGFMPDVEMHPEYFIRVEFNAVEMSPEALPVVHTCDKTIKIPKLAYDANMEVFDEKLRTSMELSMGRFDMA